MEEQLQRLLDKQAIDEVLQRYCRTLDWLDEPGQASCYWPDADIDYGLAEARTTYGAIGVKCWIFKGEVLPEAAAAGAAG